MTEQIPQITEEMVEPAILAFIEQSGLVPKGHPMTMAPLTGGVASDIWKVTSTDRCFVVKKALARLRVAREWKAPVSRNASEVEWMLQAGGIAPAVAALGDRTPSTISLDPGATAIAAVRLITDACAFWLAAQLGRDADVCLALLRAVAMIEPNARITARRPGDAIARAVFGTPVLLNTRLNLILGSERVEAVEIDRGSGLERLECDGVILTGGFRPVPHVRFHLWPENLVVAVGVNGFKQPALESDVLLEFVAVEVAVLVHIKAVKLLACIGQRRGHLRVVSRHLR